MADPETLPVDSAVESAPGLRSRLSRIAGRGSGAPAELEPILRTLRQFHPKSDSRVVIQAYVTAEELHREQKRRSGEPYITHPLAVAQILADLGMTGSDPGRRPPARHRGGHRVPAGRPARGVRRGDRLAGRRRDQARQGHLRCVECCRDGAQDGRGHGPRHPGPGHQAGRPAAQHAHPAVAGRRRSRPSRRARPWRSTPPWLIAWA